MVPDHFKFGGGAEQTVLHPLVLLAMIIAMVAIFLLPRKFIIIPVLLSTFLIPEGQQIVAGGVHLLVLRLILLAGLVRMMFSRGSIRGPLLPGGTLPIDKAVLLWVAFHVIAFIALNKGMGAVVNQFGYVWNSLGGYYLLRFLIRNKEDIFRAIKCLAFVSVIIAFCMVLEQKTGQNIFGQLGGVALLSEVRNGKIRSQGVFQHSLLAGSFGASCVPLFVLLWRNGKAKTTAAVGAFAATVMVVTAHCSTPLMAWMGGITAIFAWWFRHRMKMLRRSIVLLLIFLSFAMSAPVWFLIAHVSLSDGSSSYHRALLVDQFVRHFPDWWLIGTNENQTWGGDGSDMWDTSDRYVEEGENGGLAAFICFVSIIYLGFSRLGTLRKKSRENRENQWLAWLLGCTLFVHATAFFGVSYFDQTELAWLLLLAMICVATTLQPAVPVTPAGILKADSPFLDQEKELVLQAGAGARQLF